MSKTLNDARIKRWLAEERLIKHCPEVAGGLPTPRPAAEILGAVGNQALKGETCVITADGHDLSAAFIRGAHAALAQAGKHKIKLALLKSNSPSCGNEHVYNGLFNGTLVRGVGVTSALLRQHGVQVFNEFQIDDLENALNELEHNSKKSPHPTTLHTDRFI